MPDPQRAAWLQTGLRRGLLLGVLLSGAAFAAGALLPAAPAHTAVPALGALATLELAGTALSYALQSAWS